MRLEAGRLQRVVVCGPGPEYLRVGNLEDHNFVGRPDPRRAEAQHLALRKTMRGFGAEVVEVPECPGHPNSLFARDTALVTPEGYVRVRMGLPTRRGEEAWMAGILEGLGVPEAGSVEAPGTLEGGDVILAGEVAFVGSSPRSNRKGVEQVTGMLTRMSYEVRVQEISSRFLHIGGAMSLVGPDQVLCLPGVFPEGFFRGFRAIEVADDATSSVNVICLGAGEVVLHSGFPRTIDALDRAGLRVHALDLSEILKGGGGPTCAILPVERSG